MILNWVTRRNLAIIATFLLALKFGLLPLLVWQAEKIEELSAKKRQLAKATHIVSSEAEYRRDYVSLQQYLKGAEDYFYVDHSDTQLLIYKNIEAIFVANNLAVKSFDWVIDTPGLIRTLRATIIFSGETKNMMVTLWQLASLPQLVRQVEWNQQILAVGADVFGLTQGAITLEFYAWTPPSIESSETIVLSPDNMAMVGGGDPESE